MLKNIQECIRALIAQHGIVLGAWWPFDNTQKFSKMMSKLTLWEIMFHILMLHQNSIKTRQNLHVNVVIAY
jgi:hypothetical protein